jgi:uncharacterized protein DUF4953/uncharacterized protein DUF5117
MSSRQRDRALAPHRAMLAALLIAAACGAAGCAARSGARIGAAAAPASAKAGAGEKDKPYAEWKKVTKDAEVKRGFFTLYRKRENLYLELRPEQLGQPVLGIFSVARGIGQNFVLGGLPLNDRLLEFQRSGDRVLVLERNVRFIAPAGSAIEKAKDLSHGNSVVAALKIESVHDSSKALLVDLAPLLVSDVTDLSEWMRWAFSNKSVRFDKERSALSSVKVFPENVEIEALLTYSPNERNDLGLESVADERYIPITVHYSFTRLPERAMMPRMADDRVGYFVTAKKDFGRDEQEHFWVRYAEHWRLEKKDPGAALSEPVKPIVFYIDRTVPERYRSWVKQGVEGWQKAFEAAGLRNAIVARDAPDDPDWDPEDARYSTIRWITSHQPSFGAIGPSRVDPRTGEILDADILFEASMIQGFRNAYRRYSGPEAMVREALPWMAAREMPPFVPERLRCAAGQAFAEGGALLHLALLAAGALPPGSPVPDEYLGQAVRWVTMHEVGHTLGLRHNFRSSTSTPVDKLQDQGWVTEHGLYGSVMEYPTPNIASDRARQGLYYTPGAGTYDRWAIRYGYTPSGAADAEADREFARRIADESVQPGHEFSTDEDTYPADALDPRSNIYDLGADPLAFARARTGLIAGLWSNGKLEERVLGDDGSYPVLRRAMDTLLLQYTVALGMAIKYVGGQYHSRAHRGQPDATDPLVPVPAAEQRAALAFLGERAFAPDAFRIAPALLNRLAQDRWAHWGMPNGWGGTPFRLDYDLGNRVATVQKALLEGLLEPALMARVREAESRSAEPFRLSEHFDRMTGMIWSEVNDGAPARVRALAGPHTRREIQRAYVDRLAGLMVSPPAGTPDDARALARLQLMRIDERSARALAIELPDDVQAHLLETRARIRRALEASRKADARGGAGTTAAGAE